MPVLFYTLFPSLVKLSLKFDVVLDCNHKKNLQDETNEILENYISWKALFFSSK